jgi:hypothetical protein
MFASRYFAARYFASRFYAAGRTGAGGYYGSEYFTAYYFRANYYRPHVITTPVEPGIPSVRFTAGGASRHYPLVGFVSVDEKPDTLDAFGIITGHDAVEMDNDFLLLAAA